jgi:hypothetical protein
MLEESTPLLDVLARNRVVFVHSAGRRRFLGRSFDVNTREVTLDEVEALAAAGFDIVEVNASDGEPLCATLVSPAGRWLRSSADGLPGRYLAEPGNAATRLRPRGGKCRCR